MKDFSEMESNQFFIKFEMIYKHICNLKISRKLEVYDDLFWGIFVKLAKKFKIKSHLAINFKMFYAQIYLKTCSLWKFY